MLRCQSLVTFSTVLCLRSVTHDTHRMEIQTTRKRRLGRNGLLFSMTTNVFNFPSLNPPFFSPLSLRGNSGKTAGPYVPASLREQQCSAQHWQHPEHPLFQQQCNLTPGRARLRSDIGVQRVKGLCVDTSSLQLQGLVWLLLEKRKKIRRDFSTGKKKRLFLLGKPLCVWVCICAHNAWVNTACWIFYSMLCYMWQSY